MLVIEIKATMKLCLLVFGIFCIAVGTDALVKVSKYLEPTGDIVSHPKGFNEYEHRIRTDKGKKIILNITELSLNEHSRLKIKDGKQGEATVYRERNGKVWEIDPRGNSKIVKAGIIITAETRKIFIHHLTFQAKPSEGFSAHYTTYWENSTCLVENLRNEHSTSQSVVCDADELNPRATRCTVTYDCGAKYQQYSQIMDCNPDDGEWFGNDVRCLARPEIADRCGIDYDTLQLEEGCQITVEEMADYAKSQIQDVEEGDASLARGFGRGCIGYCKAKRYRYLRGFCRRRRGRCYVCLQFGCSYSNNLRKG